MFTRRYTLCGVRNNLFIFCVSIITEQTEKTTTFQQQIGWNVEQQFSTSFAFVA